MTARNLQSKVKSLGLPWSAAKGFDGFTPISTTFLPSADVKDPTDLRLTLAVNNELKQDGKTEDMIFGIPRLLEHVSSIMTLEVRYDSFSLRCTEPEIYAGGRLDPDGNTIRRRPRQPRRPRLMYARRHCIGENSCHA